MEVASQIPLEQPTKLLELLVRYASAVAPQHQLCPADSSRLLPYCFVAIAIPRQRFHFRRGSARLGHSDLHRRLYCPHAIAEVRALPPTCHRSVIVGATLQFTSRYADIALSSATYTCRLQLALERHPTIVRECVQGRF